MRPMLAATAESEKDIRFPCLVTPKIDGIRCLKLNDQFVSRSFKPIRNPHMDELFGFLPDGMDGELLHTSGSFQATQSAVMSYDGSKDLQYLIFDWVSDVGYSHRVTDLHSIRRENRGVENIRIIIPKLCSNVDELLAYEGKCIEDGWEGIVTRTADSPYKYGRSTLREQYMVKLKRFKDSEAIILNIGEARTNLNPITPDAFGYARRPGSASMSFGKDTMGFLEVRDVYTNVKFSIGSGFDDAMRQRVWADVPGHIGKTIRYRYQDTGVLLRPRFPTFQGFIEETS